MADSGDPVTQALIDATMASYNDTVVPAFESAASDPSTALAALEVARIWTRAAYLSGANDEPEIADLVNSVTEHMHETLAQYADWVAAQCDGGGFDQYARLLAVMRLLQLDGQEAKSAEVQEESAACAKFTVTVDYDWTRDNSLDRTDDVPMSNPDGWTNSESLQESGQLQGTYAIDLSQGGGANAGRNLTLSSYSRTYSSDYFFRTYDHIQINGTSTPAGDGMFTVSFDPVSTSLGTLRRRAGGAQAPNLGIQLHTSNLCTLLCAHYSETFTDVNHSTPETREGTRPVEPPFLDTHLIAHGDGWIGVVPMTGSASTNKYTSSRDHTDPNTLEHFTGSSVTTDQLTVSMAPAD